jgi:hypothetical protein
VLAHCGKWLLVLALILATGAHWAALQTVAWTTMLAGDLCAVSISKAVANTFDGKHPCCLCKAIAAAKQSGKKSEALSPVLKMEFPPLAKPMDLIPPAHFEILPIQNTVADSLSIKPPVPPPRALPA